ncbi:ABC transporter permease [Desulfocurvus vexinensis]|uniref:ABC transporter permease n=1 Tax=Desulfocurvus vexinensis TaxID=399548 RepID=UPI00048BB734|nr:ABC transporter permease subunit [Desulfocurvus vexinensis]
MRAALRYAAVVALLALAWKALALGPAGDVLPHPEEALAAFVRQLGRAEFWGHVRASAARAVAAMAVAWGLAFPLGVLMGSLPRLDRALSPFVTLTYPVPKIVLLPVFFLLLGLGEASRVGMIALILAYQILVTTRDGVRAVNPKYLDTIHSLGGTYRHALRHVLLPAALPHGFTALRLGTGVSVAVLFFVESFATQQGLGYFIMDSWGRLDYADMFAGIFGMSALGVALYETTDLLERRACRWRTRRG